jgi:hypothetical protein
MAPKKTSKKVAGKAAKQLHDPRSTAAEQSVAGSDLVQSEPKKKRSPKKKSK